MLKTRWLWLVCLVLLWPAFSRAQISVVLSAEKSNFLLYEAMTLSVKVTNMSDDSISLASEGDRPWLSFLVQTAERRKIRTESPIVTEPVVLAPGKSRVLSLDITPHYAIRESGQYTIQAAVELPGRRSFLTDGLVFNVGRGEVVWTKSYIEGGTQRVISLIRFTDMKDTSLYLRVEEPRENLVYTTFKLGRMISFTNPEVRIDAFRSIHILHPVGARLYRYTQTDANGRLIQQEDREAGSTPLALATRDDGRVEFVGGKKMTPESTRPKLSELQQGL